MMTISSSYLSILVFLLQLFVLQAFIDPYVKYYQLNFSPGPFGPDSVALDRDGNGPYGGISDGRMLRYDGNDFVDFAYLSPTRTKALCDGVTDINSSQTCGRPLGLTSDPSTGNFYVVGAYGNLYRVGPEGGLATVLANDVNGVRFNFLDGIDYDKSRNVLYFTDASLTYTFKDQVQGKPYPPGESSGRLMEYDIATGKRRVLLQNLPIPVGPAVSEDGKFVVYSCRKTNQVFKYSLVGPNAGKTVVLLNLPGYPIKTKRAPFGTFWVAVNVQKSDGTLNPFGYKFDINGIVLLIKNLGDHYPNSQVNVVQEYNRRLGAELYIGSRMVRYVGKYRTIL